MKTNKWIKVEVVCSKEEASKHNLKDEDMYIDVQYVHYKTPLALLSANPKYYPSIVKGLIVTPFNSLPTVHSVEELVEMFSGEE